VPEELEYQYNYSDLKQSVFSVTGRQRKAATMVAIMAEHLEQDLGELSVLSVGGSTGIIDEYLARHFQSVCGIDIDEKAIAYAKENFQRDNLSFEIGDALHLKHKEESFDVVICAHIYEHVPDAAQMMNEIYRVLRPGGTVYFAAANRIALIEPHYKLPLLSIPPRPISNLYLRLTGKGKYYYEKHLTYWGLKKLVRKFQIADYTTHVLEDPNKYETTYMVAPGSATQKLAIIVSRYFTWVMPNWIWLLKKPG